MAEAFLYGVGGGGPSTVLSAVTLSSNGTYLPSQFSVDGFSEVTVNVQAEEDGDQYLKGTLTYYSDSTLSNIAQNVFANQPLSKIYLGSIIFMPSYAFDSCIRLSQIFADNVSTVYTGAFRNCKALTSAYFPNCTSVYNAFEGCRTLHSLLLSSNVTINTGFNLRDTLLEEYNVFSADALITNYFPLLVKSINAEFCNLAYSAIDQVNMQNLRTLEKINLSVINATGCFAGCVNLIEASIFSTNVQNTFVNCTALRSVTIKPSTLFRAIQSYTFSQCIVLSEIVVSENTIFNINSAAFYKCYNLKSFATTAITRLSTLNYAFYNCFELSSVHLYVSSGASLVARSVAAYAFTSCVNLSYVSLGTAASLGAGLFMDCVKLSEIRLSYVQSIAANAFMNCINLSKVVLDMCVSMSSTIFQNCYLLRELYLLNSSSICIINASTFYKSPLATEYLSSLFKIYVKSSLLDSYKTYTNWITYSSNIFAYTEE